jgi:ERCC4-type nuclease
VTNSVMWIDSRVGSKELLPGLQKAGIDARLTILDAGDFMFEGNGPDGTVTVGIERKTIGDLVSSLQGGRLQGLQWGKLHDTYDFVWLLVEGIFGADKQGRLTVRKGPYGQRRLPGAHLTADGLTKALMTLELKGGLRVKQTFSRDQSVDWLVACMRWWSDKVWDGHKTLLTPYSGHKAIGKISMFREVVMKLPDIGLGASKAVELAFRGSLDRLLQSQLSDWSELELVTPRGPRRLGEAKALRVIEAIQQLKKGF